MPFLLTLPLASAVLRILRAYPHLHDHAVWADTRPEGTAHNIAGWTVTLAGAEWGPFHGMVTYRGKLRSIPMLAQELLGLNYSEALTLFYHCDEQQAEELLARWIGNASLAEYCQQFVLDTTGSAPADTSTRPACRGRHQRNWYLPMHATVDTW